MVLSSIVKSENKELTVSWTYPCIAYSKSDSDLKVLFFEHECGVVLDEDSNLHWQVGSFNDEWEMDSFAEFIGKITIQSMQEY